MSDHNLLNLSINCGLMLRNVNTANCPLADSAVIDFVRVRHGNGGWEEGGMGKCFEEHLHRQAKYDYVNCKGVI